MCALSPDETHTSFFRGATPKRKRHDKESEQRRKPQESERNTEARLPDFGKKFVLTVEDRFAIPVGMLAQLVRLMDERLWIWSKAAALVRPNSDDSNEANLGEANLWQCQIHYIEGSCRSERSVPRRDIAASGSSHVITMSGNTCNIYLWTHFEPLYQSTIFWNTWNKLAPAQDDKFFAYNKEWIIGRQSQSFVKNESARSRPKLREGNANFYI
ncbi:hypothetical protein BDP55DRAFT_713567 [Colletotrichum godetiae]|uniref:Uncharacterized protein n=1 Tax=Colletotrichum godetiae TaxID=1209918 RepID=A0AAJ0AQ09_9PEZI|nr:uncharacterized protein BDP55DRAFT_713567 [Colletotrichum godetiae]KAK1688260.1 hypothetical protein BDP55DRAFT_713567 [Colletotrichum godetiae]